jgi:hypothetical protein
MSSGLKRSFGRFNQCLEKIVARNVALGLDGVRGPGYFPASSRRAARGGIFDKRSFQGLADAARPVPAFSSPEEGRPLPVFWPGRRVFSMNRPSRTAALLASLLLSSLGGSLASQETPADPQTETFKGEIEVREIGIVVAPPEDKSLAGVRPADILVSEEGTARTVLKAEPLRPDSWRLVLYFDRALAGPDATLDSALTFSRKARELTDLGTVEVVVADPEPRVALAATRDLKLHPEPICGVVGVG